MSAVKVVNLHCLFDV